MISWLSVRFPVNPCLPARRATFWPSQTDIPIALSSTVTYCGYVLLQRVTKVGRRGQEKCICHGYLIVVLFRGGGIGVAISLSLVE